MDPKKNIADMMPWYVNKTLDEASSRRLENLLQGSPAVQAEVSWLERLREQIQGKKDTRQLPAPDAGLDRLMALIAAEKSGKVSNITRPAKPLSAWYGPAFAIAASVMFVQAIGLHMLLQGGSGADTIRALSGATGVKSGDVLQVTFQSATTESQIRGSLAAIHGEIVGGPGALGIYDVRVEKGRGADAAAKLAQQAGVIDSVSQVAN